MASAADLYPPGPAKVPGHLTNPTPAYRRHAWIATAVLLLFVCLYAFLAGWFSFTAWRLLDGLREAGEDNGLLLFGGIFAAFLAIFMLKGLVFMTRGAA